MRRLPTLVDWKALPKNVAVAAGWVAKHKKKEAPHQKQQQQAGGASYAAELVSNEGTPSFWKSDAVPANTVLPTAIVPAAVLGDMMATALNQPGFTWQCSPIATELELAVCDALCEPLRLPAQRFSWASGQGGMAMQSSLADALTVAVLGARESALRLRRELNRSVLYCSPNAPQRLDKAAAVLGIPLVRRVRADILSQVMTVDASMALTPIAVVASVANGAADDVPAFIAAAKQARCQSIVDAGTSGFMAVGDAGENGGPLAEWGKADTVVFSAGALVPIGSANSAFVAFAECRHIAAALSASGKYIENEHTLNGSVVDLKDYHLGLGRNFRSMKLFTALQALGINGLRAIVKRHSQLCERLTEACKARGFAAVQTANLGSVVVDLAELVGSPADLQSLVVDPALSSTRSDLFTLTCSGTAFVVTLQAADVTAADVDAFVADVARAVHKMIEGAANVTDDAVPMASSSDEAEAALPLLPACLSWAGFPADAEAVASSIAAYHSEMSARDDDGLATTDLPALPTVKPGFLKVQLADSPIFPEAPVPTQDLVPLFDRLVKPAASHWHHPRFYAFFPCSLSPGALVGDMVGVALDDPALLELDGEAAKQYATMLGLESFVDPLPGRNVGKSVTLQPSATEGLLLACIAAREAKLQEATAGLFFESESDGTADIGHDGDGLAMARADMAAKLVAYIGADAHFAAEKAARVAGIRHIRKVPSRASKDGNTTMNLGALEDAVMDDIVAGNIPFFVSCSIGATGNGAIDDVKTLRGLASTHGMWLNIDAAYAGAAACIPEQRALPAYAGWDAADSLQVNATKMMCASFNGSLLFMKKTSFLADAFGNGGKSVTAAGTQSLNHDQTHLADGDHPARGLKLLYSLNGLGGETGVRSLVQRHMDAATVLETELRDLLPVERVTITPARWGLVCLHLVGKDQDAHTRLAAAISERHRAFVGAGAGSVRFSIAHPDVTTADMKALARAVNDVLPSVIGG